MTETSNVSDACETPLVELLRAIPSDHRAQWTDDDSPYGSHSAPVGRYCQQAADLIEAQTRADERTGMGGDAGLVDMDICPRCNGSGEGVADTTCTLCNGSGGVRADSMPVAWLYERQSHTWPQCNPIVRMERMPNDDTSRGFWIETPLFAALRAEAPDGCDCGDSAIVGTECKSCGANPVAALSRTEAPRDPLGEGEEYGIGTGWMTEAPRMAGAGDGVVRRRVAEAIIEAFKRTTPDVAERLSEDWRDWEEEADAAIAALRQASPQPERAVEERSDA